jgi:hypothetical protein
MRFVAGVVLGVSLAAAAGAAQSSVPNSTAGTQAEVSFEFDRPGLAVPRFSIRVHEDGTGSYQAEEVSGPADGGTVHYASAKHIDRTMSMTPATVSKIFKTARELNRFDMNCNSKAKNLANTGKKTLSYAGPDGSGSCVYNYSDSREVEMLTSIFLGIAYTMDEGRRLEFLHRYDRLGLDAEMTAMEDSVKMGRALELNTIEPVLTSIAKDTAVMQRVRQQAAKFLETARNNNM